MLIENITEISGRIECANEILPNIQLLLPEPSASM